MSLGRLKVAAALVLTSPFVPMLFQGEEWGATTPFQYFTDHADPELGRAVSEGRRKEFASFGWKPEDVPDPQDPATFERSKLDWDEIARPPHDELLAWHRDLIALRQRLPALSDGRMDKVRTEFDEAGRWLVVHRGPVSVATNVGAGEVRLPVEGALGLASEPGVATNGELVTLPPDSVAVLDRG
jgi:maltooligosyltrehalose trehalohydrolase